jgi:hypothetical protein
LNRLFRVVEAETEAEAQKDSFIDDIVVLARSVEMQYCTRVAKYDVIQKCYLGGRAAASEHTQGFFQDFAYSIHSGQWNTNMIRYDKVVIFKIQLV